jgi:broad specificity phosphatase PhoE
MASMLAHSWVGGIQSVWSSTERKARDGAAILASHLHLPAQALSTLGENDRSATGFLPREEFETVADQFFANPTQNVRGWESARDAQRRIVSAVDHVLARSSHNPGDIAVVAHGGVGTLLLCALRNDRISREHDQPPNNGGNYFAFNALTRDVLHGWRRIDAK